MNIHLEIKWGVKTDFFTVFSLSFCSIPTIISASHKALYLLILCEHFLCGSHLFYSIFGVSFHSLSYLRFICFCRKCHVKGIFVVVVVWFSCNICIAHCHTLNICIKQKVINFNRNLWASSCILWLYKFFLL